MKKKAIIEFEKKQTAIIKKNNNPVSTYKSADLIISQLIKKDFDLEKIEKLLALKGRYEAEENKKMFYIKFSQLQSSLPEIQKTKKVFTKAGKLMYSYAPLSEVIKQIKPVLKNYGFSYKWSEEVSEKPGFKKIYCHIMGYGHEEKSYVELPVQPGNDYVNSVQQSGSSNTYGQRYSLINALGLTGADQDDDAKTPGDNIELNGKSVNKDEYKAIDKKIGTAVKIIGWDKKKFLDYIKFVFKKDNYKNLEYEIKEKLLACLNKEIDEESTKNGK